MPTSSARPDDLDGFSRGSRAADDELRATAARLRSAYEAFQSRCKWGTLDAGSLLNGLDPQFLGFNEEDARWVETIAAEFLRAGGSGDISTLPDAAIAASLANAGLGDVRGSVTFDDPVALGFPPTSGYADDPVNTATGNFVELEVDLPFGGLLAGLRFARTYNSRSERVGPFGTGWSSWATARLRPCPEGAEYDGPDGQRALFPRMGSGYGRVVGVNAAVEPLESGLALAWFGGGRWEFDDAGLPVRAAHGPGTEVRLRHDEEGRLVELVHEGAKSIELRWEGERIVAAACSDGRRVSYEYGEDGSLVQVEGSGGTRRYAIDDVGRIISVTDADGVVEVVNTYDADGRVLEQLSPFGRRTRFTYLRGRVTVTNDDDGGPANTYVHDDAGRVLAIVDGDDQRMGFNYDEWGNPVVVTERGGGATIQEWDERARLVRRVLPTGAKLTFAYDDADRVVEVAASNGAVTRLRYSGDERSPFEIVDPEGGVSRMRVEGGLVREVVDPDGVRLRFEFDDDGNIVATIDADGNVARTERDAAGRVTAAVTPLGRRTTFAYDDRGLPVERRDPAGGVWRYEHTAAGRLTSVTDPTGARRETQYGEHGSPTATIDPLGHVTAQRYDVFGNVVGVVAPDGAAWQYGYDALMRLTTIDDPTGATWQREYDVDGNLVGSVDPVGTHYSASIDPAGRVTALSDGVTSSAFEFDEFGRAVAHVRPDGTQARCEYDLCGRRVSIQDPVGGITRLQFSPGGKVVREIAPSGRIDENEYDGCGRLAARIDGAGRRTEYRYDADRALVEIVDPTGELTHFRYDDNGWVVEASQPGRGVTRYDYDAAGRTTAITDRVAGTRTFDRDAAGRLVAATDANGGVTRYAYDERGRLTEIVDPLGGRTVRRHDAAGRLVAQTDPLGRTATLIYDAAGRIVERVDGSNRTTRWSFDPSGRVSSFAGAGGEPITIERDALGREISIDEPGAFVDELRWDGAGRLVERRRDEKAMSWRYTPDGERAAIGYPDGSQTAFTHDAGGLLVGKHHPGLGSIELERDAAGRLVGATADGMRKRWRYERGDLAEYRCEAAGKTRTAQLTRDGVGRVVEAIVDEDRQRYSYDPAGQLLSAETPRGALSFSYDANGRLERETSPVATLDYEYDVAGQLLARRDGADAAVTEYEYDGAGRRVREVEADFSRTWRWDELGRLAQVDTSAHGDDSPRSTQVAVDALGELAQVDGTDLMWDTANAFAPLTWMGRQAVVGDGSPWALAGDGAAKWLAPDWQGTVGEADRDPWGAASSGADRLQLGYRGELEFDGQTWLRSRVYEPATRSFLSPDPRPPVAGAGWAANPYHYAANNPLNLSDPLGLRPISDSELQTYRDQMNRNVFEQVGDFVAENIDYVAAAALVVGGGLMMATGVGGPVGLMMVSAGVSAGMQKFTTGEVNWTQVAVDGVLGAVTGGAGAGLVRRAAFEGGASLASGMADRGLHGENPFDPRGLATDLLTAGVAVAPGGRLGASTRAVPLGGADEAATLFHYTDEAGMQGIRESGEIRPSLSANNPNDVRYGEGQYLSDIQPGTKTNAQLSRNFINNPFQGQRFSHYVEIDTRGLNPIEGRPGVFVIPGDQPLDVSDRLVGYGRNE
ncbi:MAG TPA: HYD1 signature containing ADP-ribosyltransferase family protein [Solirubrobacteraceae bacterium]|nr:HYD1 signature containing ADP-ribosyltransferase family protein [Solirubrobacteraceae bacterium]